MWLLVFGFFQVTLKRVAFFVLGWFEPVGTKKPHRHGAREAD